jgi:hypothetical protein
MMSKVGGAAKLHIGDDPMKSLFLLAGASALVLCATTASAQQTVSLSAGFLPDPVTFDVVSGGGNDASDLGGSCVGAIASSPDVVVNFRSNGGPLSFGVYSDGDTTLVINGPDGRYYCSDDVQGLNPAFGWDSAPSGQYDIWVGAIGEPASSTLVVTEGSVFGD